MPAVDTKLAIPRTGFAKALKAFYDFVEKFSFKTILDAYETVTMAASPQDVDLDYYETKVVTAGVGQVLNIGNGTGVKVGHRKLITLQTRTGGSDTVVLDHANMNNAAGSAASSCVLDAANEFILLEWRGSKWQTIVASAGVIS